VVSGKTRYATYAARPKLPKLDRQEASHQTETKIEVEIFWRFDEWFRFFFLATMNYIQNMIHPTLIPVLEGMVTGPG